MWLKYREKYGPMNDIRRHDRPAALLGSILSRANGGKAEIKDLMPWGKKEAEEQEPSLEDIIKSVGGIKIGERG